jgi:hypothetical protein
MSETHIRINDEDENLFCTYSKERIEIGERYAIVIEVDCFGDKYEKPFKLEYAPTDEDDEEPYIMEE